MQRDIYKEIRKNSLAAKGSYFDGNNTDGGLNSHVSNELIQELKDLVNRKVDKQDFRDFTYMTVSKNEYEAA